MHSFPKRCIRSIYAYGFTMVYEILVFKQLTRNEMSNSSRDCFEKWNDLTYLNERFKYVIGNGGLGEMMAVDRTGGGQLVCVISPICLGGDLTS